jgi:hypothetical protein
MELSFSVGACEKVLTSPYDKATAKFLKESLVYVCEPFDS